MRTLSILLLCIFTLPFCMKVGVFVHWQINKARITQLYCINKNKPRLHCDGKCYLAQQLRQIDAQQLEDVRNAEHPIVPIEKLAKTEFSPAILGAVWQCSSLCFIAQPIPKKARKGLAYAFFYHFEAEKTCFQPPEICLA